MRYLSLLFVFSFFFNGNLNAELKTFVISKPLKGVEIEYAVMKKINEGKELNSKPKKSDTSISSTPIVLSYDTESKSAEIKYSGGSDTAVCIPASNTMTFMLLSAGESVMGASFVKQTYVVHLNHKKDGEFLVTMTIQKNTPMATVVSMLDGWAQ